MKTAALLRKARKTLLRRGWYQGDFIPEGANPATCRVCVLGALNLAAGLAADDGISNAGGYRAAAKALNDVVGEHIAGWQDVPGRTLPEVLAAIDSAIERLP